jgi:hypothetical protein
MVEPSMPAADIIRNRAISTIHTTASSIAALLLLRYSSWPVPEKIAPPLQRSKDEQQLDDSRNPMINGRNLLANALTTWETAYLIYDTYDLLRSYRGKTTSQTTLAGLRIAAKKSPVVLAHHVFLTSAFLVLQSYILAGREKGLWVITALLLMNSSNPLMHARWWQRQRTGKASNTLDFAFLTTFAVSRFGLVVWILNRYGKHHGVGPMQAYFLLRRKCQIGTATLTVLNGAWWTILAFNTMRRILRKGKLVKSS